LSDEQDTTKLIHQLLVFRLLQVAGCFI